MIQRKIKPGTITAVYIGLLKVGIFIVALAAIFFLCAGRQHLSIAWLYVAIVFVNTRLMRTFDESVNLKNQ